MLAFHLLVLVLLAKFVEYDDLNSLVESCTNASMDMTEREQTTSRTGFPPVLSLKNLTHYLKNLKGKVDKCYFKNILYLLKQM